MINSVVIDGVTLSDATDFDAFVRDVLRGGGGVGSLPSDAAPLDWISRAYDQLRGTPLADRLSRGVASCLAVPEPYVQSQALVFFQSEPRAAGGEQIDALVAGDRSRFAGVADPMHPSVDLDWQLLTALAPRVSRDPHALDLARREALVPGKAQPVIGALATAAPDWVVAHAEDIVRGTPPVGITIFMQLQGKRGDLVQLARRIAPLCHGDDRFESYATRFINDVALRDSLLEAFRSPAN